MRNPPTLQLLPSAVTIAVTLAVTGCSVLTLTPSYVSNVMEVDRLCEKDGGIRIYETIPKGNLGFKLVEDKNFPGGGFEHVSLSEDGKYRYAIKSTRIRPAPDGERGIGRAELRMWRTSDEKLLGEAIGYGTSSGEHASVPGYRHHTCAQFKGQPLDWLFSRAMRGR
jgi:hypothetical protein